MGTRKKTTVSRPPASGRGERRSAISRPADVTVRLSYNEAALLVVGANLALGLASRPGASDEDHAMAGVASDIIDKLYQAEPALKRDASQVEGEMRTFLAHPLGDDAAADDDPFDDTTIDSTLRGQEWFGVVADAIETGQEIALGPNALGGQERRLKPLGAGHVGDVAIAIGWTDDTKDFTALRLDQVGAVRPTGRAFNDDDGELCKACLDRFDRQPRQGSD